jgi:hypothetical protein
LLYMRVNIPNFDANHIFTLSLFPELSLAHISTH